MAEINNDDNITTHESFGAIRIARAQGMARPLFGSSIKHSDIILFTISNCELDRHLNTDWYHPTDTVLEFTMSHNQFAQMLTQINSNAVPITFKRKPTGPVKHCEAPPYESVIEKHKSEFSSHLENINNKAHNLVKELSECLNSSKLKKSDKEKLIGIAQNILTEIQSNSEYQLDAFNEQMDKTVTECKNEIEKIIETKSITHFPKLIE
jgi:hypothetical protein